MFKTKKRKNLRKPKNDTNLTQELINSHILEGNLQNYQYHDFAQAKIMFLNNLRAKKRKKNKTTAYEIIKYFDLYPLSNKEYLELFL